MSLALKAFIAPGMAMQWSASSSRNFAERCGEEITEAVPDRILSQLNADGIHDYTFWRSRIRLAARRGDMRVVRPEFVRMYRDVRFQSVMTSFLFEVKA